MYVVTIFKLYISVCSMFSAKCTDDEALNKKIKFLSQSCLRTIVD